MFRLCPVTWDRYPFRTTVKAMARLFRIVLAAAGLLAYTWIAAVRSLPRVKARKARRAR
jgi:hypothetical protein